MQVVGYTDRLSAAPGESVQFMVSCKFSAYRVDIVRLIHGDTHPDGPGFKEVEVEAPVNGEYQGRLQVIERGSYISVSDRPLLRLGGGFTFCAWVYPTLPGAGRQGLLSKGAPDGNVAYGLTLDEDGALMLLLADGQGRVEQHSTGTPLRAGAWSFVAAAFDGEGKSVRLNQVPLERWLHDRSHTRVERTTSIAAPAHTEAPFLMAAQSGPEPIMTRDHFNGKLESPRVFNRALTDDELDALLRGADPAQMGDVLVAAWDFGRDISSAMVTDVSGNDLHGRAVNMPARAVTGHDWTGEEVSFNHAPEQYAAIHFHEDDLEDALWEVDFALTIPEGMPSGVYAARLRAEDGEEHVPFFVQPGPSKPSAPILFLAPTLSYLAYGNYHLEATPEGRADMEKLAGRVLEFDYPVEPAEHFMVDQNLLSHYETHADGSGVFYVSHLCPQMVIRPKYRHPGLAFGAGAPHQLGADLHLLDWMESKGFTFDVTTDHDLHADGLALLSMYRVVVTGTHPEYWTGAMLDALEGYLADGGRLIYMGGNGFYWVTSIDPARPHIIEIRRWGGSQSWRVEPGEAYHSTTGELGGLWRERGRTPQKLTGVGFTSQGFDTSLAFRRLPDSHDPRAAFIFEGMSDDELIGDFGLVMGGAGGYEIDRADSLLGTPPHALVLATATGFSDVYQHVVEEVDVMNRVQGGSVNPRVRADMVYYEGPSRGAVFSVGSIAWCGSLSHNNYENNVSRITANVLSAFASEEGPPRVED